MLVQNNDVELAMRKQVNIHMTSRSWDKRKMHACYAKSLHSCPTPCNPMDFSPPGLLSMGFSRQEYWSGLPLPFPGDLPDTEIEPMSPALQKDSWPLSHWGSVTSVLHFLPIQVTSEYWAQFPVLYTGFSLVVSVLYIQCVCVSSPTSQFISAPLPRLVSIHFCFMSLSLFCFASRFICTIFLNSTYMHRSVFSVGKFLCFRTRDVKLWNMKAQRDKVTFYQSQ